MNWCLPFGGGSRFFQIIRRGTELFLADNFDFWGNNSQPGEQESSPAAADEAGREPAAVSPEEPTAPRFIPADQAPQYQQPAPDTPPSPPYPSAMPNTPGTPNVPGGQSAPFFPPEQNSPYSGVPQQRQYIPAQTPQPGYPQQPYADPASGQQPAPYGQQPNYPSGQPGYTPYTPGGYSPYYPPAAPPAPGNGFGIASLVLGILSILLFCIPFLNVALSLLALILGIVAKVKGCGGVAVAGIVLGSVGLVLSVLLFIGIALEDVHYYLNEPGYYYKWDSFRSTVAALFHR